MPARRAVFLGGVRAELPLLVGVIPFGMIYGVLAVGAGLPPVAAQAMSAIIFAGSAQFVATQMIHLQAPALVIVLTVAVVNLRHVLYSASLAPYLKPLRPAWKWLLAYLLTDEAYAVVANHYRQATDLSPGAILAGAELDAPPRAANQHWYFLGAGLTLWGSWQISTALGVFLGAVVPEGWSLDFTLALTFIAIVVPNLKDRASVIAGLTAGVAAVLAVGFPLQLGLVLAALVGILAGVLAERRQVGDASTEEG